jgi:hypothetical protein
VKCPCAILLSVACPAPLYFSTLFHKGPEFRRGKKVTEHKMCVLIYCANFSKISHSKNSRSRCYQNCTQFFIKITPHSCHILIKLELSRQILENYTNIKFHENLSSECRVVLYRRKDGQTDRHDGANSRFSQFCERAEKTKLSLISDMCKRNKSDVLNLIPRHISIIKD